MTRNEALRTFKCLAGGERRRATGSSAPRTVSPPGQRKPLALDITERVGAAPSKITGSLAVPPSKRPPTKPSRRDVQDQMAPSPPKRTVTACLIPGWDRMVGKIIVARLSRRGPIYSLIVTAKMNDIDPQALLADGLARSGHRSGSLVCGQGADRPVRET